MKLFYNIRIGKNFRYRKRFQINCEKKAIINIGNNVFFNNDCSINIHKQLSIGNNCIFGEGVKIYDHNHVFNKKDIPIRDQGFKDKDVTIGNNCWFGSNVIVLPGAVVGDNVVVSAGGIVKGIINSNCIIKIDSQYQYSEEITYR